MCERTKQSSSLSTEKPSSTTARFAALARLSASFVSLRLACTVVKFAYVSLIGISLVRLGDQAVVRLFKGWLFLFVFL